ncbi:MAG TPA: DMT family transporter [Candidatus Methylomirabilis sp.]|nr:DMT family transporter [Candidatus Methylomirabilis sp.]
MTLFSESNLGAAYAIGCALSWSVIGLLVRALSPAFNSVTLNAVRSTLGAILIVGWVALTGGLTGLTAMSGTAFVLLAVSVVLAVWLGDTVFFESTRDLGLARAMTVSMTYPLIAAVLAALFLGESLTLGVAVGSVLIIVGVGLTVMAETLPGATVRGRFWLGVAAATLASIAWAASVVVLKPSLGEVDAIQAQAVRLPVAAATLWITPWSWGGAIALRRQAAATLWRLVALGCLTAVSSILFVAGVRHAGVAVATVLSSTAPIFAIPLGVLFVGERLTAAALLGAIVTVVGIAVLQL